MKLGTALVACAIGVAATLALAACAGPRGLRVRTLNLAHGRGAAAHQVLLSPGRIEANLEGIAAVLRRCCGGRLPTWSRCRRRTDRRRGADASTTCDAWPTARATCIRSVARTPA